MLPLAKTDPQKTIAEHTADLSRLWENFEKLYPDAFNAADKNLIKIAIEYHDLGKLNDLFQAKIRTNKKTMAGEISHGFLSCAYFDLGNVMQMKDFRILLTAIYNHHTRKDDIDVPPKLLKYVQTFLPECYTDEITKKEYALKDKQAEYLQYIIPAYRNTGCPTKRGHCKEGYLKYITVKGMLNRADYSASAGEAIEIEPADKNFFHNQIGNIFKEKGYKFRPVQKYMLGHKNDNLVVIASTGCGKTEAALLWLDGCKAFYTLPMKVSINAIYERIRDEYKYDEKKMTLLHSGMLSYYIAQRNEIGAPKIKDEPIDRQKKAKLLSYPLTVCTVDQLFYFVFKAMGTEMIPATLKYSKIIIDEIQMYSPEILACIIYGLKIITELGGKFTIITATFPPILGDFLDEYLSEKSTFFLKSQEYSLQECSKRHKIHCLEGELDYNLIFSRGQKYKILVLCNTVKKAQEVYKILQEKTKSVPKLQ